MKFLLRIITGAITASLTLNPAPINTIDSLDDVPTALINNGSLMLYAPGEVTPTVLAPPTPVLEPPALRPEPPTPPALSGSDLGSVVEQTFKSGGINNQTSIKLPRNISDELPFIIHQDSEFPQVLIYHTHTTEAFIGTENFRSLDEKENIISVGAKIAEEIADAGFAVIHDTTVHDDPMYSGSYKRSAKTVQAILNKYPSIKIVLDVHRDAIEVDDKPVAAVTNNSSDSKAAQVMIVAPADNKDGDWGVPLFMHNFRFAYHLQSQLEEDYGDIELPRSIMFQYCNYNLHLSTGALLIEIGSHGNTLEQALNAAELFGQSVGRLLVNNY
jgi:stage II sporulation protein P